MAFIDEWQSQLQSSFASFSELAQRAPEIRQSIITTAILWPVRSELQGGGGGYDALVDMCGAGANQIVRIIRSWPDDPEAAARNLAQQMQTNERLQAALDTLIDGFGARQVFENTAETDGHSYHIENVKGGAVSISGVQNITIARSPTGKQLQRPPRAEHFTDRTEELAQPVKRAAAGPGNYLVWPGRHRQERSGCGSSVALSA